MLREDIQPSFSDMWYRVSGTRPRLSPHASLSRQRYGPEVNYIVEEPASGHYYRVSEAGWFFLGLLDGTRTVEDAWNTCNEQLGDEAPTQRECVEVLSKLQLFGLLMGEQPLAPDMIEQRINQARQSKLKRRLGRWLFISIPLFNPEPVLRQAEPLIRALFTRWAFVIWLVAVLGGLAIVLPRWRELGSDLDMLLAPSNLIWIAVLFLFLRTIHEFGHAAACKAMGGRSTEIGIIMIAFVFPLPYCDATDAWRFPETWRRVLVSAAGMMAELFVASIAAVVWATSDPGLARTLAYNALLISGITTLVFNLNPLLRYDGYYILSDLMGSPNLAQRSRELWKYTFERGVFRVPHVKPPHVRDRPEGALMTIYGALATPYRLLITFSIVLLVSTQYVTLGLVIAAVALCVFFIWPVIKGLAYLAGSPKLAGRRARAVGLVAAAVIAVVAPLTLIPVPAAAYAPAIVEPTSKSAIRSPEDGFLDEVLAEPGELVSQGQPLFRLRNSALVSELEVAEARLEQARAVVDEAINRGGAHRRVAEKQVEELTDRRDRLQRRVDNLIVRAPQSGYVYGHAETSLNLSNTVGQYVTRGMRLATVASTDELVVRASVRDRDHGYIFRNASDPLDVPASVRVRGNAGRVVDASLHRVAPAGTRQISHAALSINAGGEIPIDPRDPDSGRTLEPRFLVELTPDSSDAPLHAGQRARIRLAAPPEPVASQVWRRVRQSITIRPAR